MLVAPEINAAIQMLADQGKIVYQQDSFRDEYLPGKTLAIAATDNVQVNRHIAAQARLQHIPVNVVNDPQSGSFIVPSIVDRNPVFIAISTGGKSPVLARLLKARLQTMIPMAYGRLANLMANFREAVKQKFSDIEQRRHFWEQVLQGPVAEMLFSGREQAALSRMQQELNTRQISQGEVYLVGGGPGDPDLLTFRALRLIQQADVVIYDRLVSPDIVGLARQDAEYIYVGKERDQHTVPQDQINQLLIDYARQGKRVLRLKGGDPFIFGRGGEEIEELSEEGIAFQIVPGISAANGCASYAGIPLTHRDHAQACVFVTGHMKDGHLDLNWEALAKPQQTIVVYMGIQGLETLSRQLMQHGLAADTPAALIEKGTTVGQKVYCSTLEALAQVAEDNAISPPALVIIGTVVSLRDKLAWFDNTD